MSQPCFVCHRIPPKTVFKAAHQVFKEYDKQIIHKIAETAVEIINYADSKNRLFFCGRIKAGLLAGLFYAIALKLGIAGSDQPHRITQKGIASVLGTNVPTLRDRFRDWCEQWPELFEEAPSE